MKNYFGLISMFALTAGISFVNQMVYAYYFGVSTEFDMLNAILALPLAIIGIGNGAVTLIVMPILNDAEEKFGNCSSTLVSLLKKYYIYILFIIIIIVLIQISIFYNQIDNIYKKRFIYLSMSVGIFLFLNFVNAFFIAYFNLKKDFLLASISAMFIYIISILMCILFADEIGINIVIIAFIISNIILLCYFIYKFYPNYKQINNNEVVLNDKIKFKALISGIFSIFPFSLPIFIDSYYLLSLGTGSLSYVSYANKMIIMITSILIQPLNLILFPKILSKISSKDFLPIKRILLYLYVFTFIGIILVYFISNLFFLYLMHIFFENGKFTHEDSIIVYHVFLIYLIGAFGMVAMNIQNKILTSLKLYNIQIYSSLVFILLYFFLMSILYETKGYLSSAISYAICWCLYTIFAAIILKKKFFIND